MVLNEVTGVLSQKIIDFSQSKNWWYGDTTLEYEEALRKLAIPLDSDFAKFYLHVEDGPTFLSRGKELYHICWFMINSDYMLSMRSTHEALKLPEAYIPLDSFEGEYGYFYNRQTDEVLCLGLGQEWHDFMQGKLQPQWSSFNQFLLWYFELTD